MKKNISGFNRLFCRLISPVLLLAIYLSPTMGAFTKFSDGASGEKMANVFTPASFAMTTSATNSTPISIADNPGTASPYPSQITISGAVGAITNVTVVFNNLSISRPRDLDILLIGPGGESLILMSDVGGITSASASSNINITLQDGSPALPADTDNNAQLASGTFRPTNNGAGEGSLPSPAPAGPYNNPQSNPGGTACTGCAATFTNVFAQPGVPANGVWSLYVDDDAGGGTTVTNEMTGGWTLNVTTNNIPTASMVNVGGRIISPEGFGVDKATVSLTDSMGETRTVLSNPFGYYCFSDVAVGDTYIFSVISKRYSFEQPVQIITITDETDDINFTATK